MDRKNARDFPQELLNLFDRYVHGDIGRREFLDGAKKFAVGGYDRHGHMGEPSPELRLGGTSRQRRQPHQDRIGDGAVAAGKWRAYAGTWCVPAKARRQAARSVWWCTRTAA